jgi:phage shock protein A
MPQSLLGKIGLLLSATLHSIVDRALESNSLGVFDEYIRQAESSMRLLRDALIDLRVTVKSLKTKYEAAANDAARLDLQVDAALKADKETLAKATMLRMNNQLEIARTYKDQLDKQGNTYDTLIEVVDVLQAKVDVLKTQREQVASLLELIKSKNIIARSMKDIERISDSKATQIMDKVRSDLDTADARLEVATSRLSTQLETTIEDATLEAQLEERRARLGLT